MKIDPTGGSQETVGASRPAGSEPAPAEIRLPTRVVVSLRAGAVLALANVLCVVIFSWAWMRVRTEPKVLSVTGSAKRLIESDLIVWKCRISASHMNLVEAYTALTSSREKLIAYLQQKGVGPQEITPKAVTSLKRFKRNDQGIETDELLAHDLTQEVEISSARVKEVSDLANNITELIKEGIYLESEPPRFIYTKLAEFKVAMLADATKDATARAQQIATNSGARLGAIQEARMGVMQINPLHSNDVSDSGNNDTTSLKKELTAVVSARFELQ